MSSTTLEPHQKELFGHPIGLFTLFFTEMWERFSYYGMKAILVIFFTHDLGMSDALAREYYHAFTAACYFFPLCGALLAETVLGKYRTIMRGQ